ncbi:MAG: hypothetical protein ACOVQ1_04435, partial [Candidatus Planktophila sp.]
TGASALADAFLTARLRGVLGSIAMAPNPLCPLRSYILKKSCWVFRTVRAGLVSRLIASRAELVP